MGWRGAKVIISAHGWYHEKAAMEYGGGEGVCPKVFVLAPCTYNHVGSAASGSDEVVTICGSPPPPLSFYKVWCFFVACLSHCADTLISVRQ
jgi:hypothetical protein